MKKSLGIVVAQFGLLVVISASSWHLFIEPNYQISVVASAFAVIVAIYASSWVDDLDVIVKGLFFFNDWRGFSLIFTSKKEVALLVARSLFAALEVAFFQGFMLNALWGSLGIWTILAIGIAVAGYRAMIQSHSSRLNLLSDLWYGSVMAILYYTTGALWLVLVATVVVIFFNRLKYLRVREVVVIQAKGDETAFAVISKGYGRQQHNLLILKDVWDLGLLSLLATLKACNPRLVVRFK